ncbi:hypothetical protein BDEG_20224 [Batrachochytrium dendrobatidis JEL423]|uniref:Uncharacterized protein n=1 Tax=Batrachochytrium dendrobatidis (strain JEL423) TaxID=403673 RepID=A0A177W8L8_BATDL|nr:hypothetical protein BDEG_20224 [Batrachochytrium dendrobatidis JEL423]
MGKHDNELVDVQQKLFQKSNHWSSLGVIILSIAIILSCFLGQLQQHVYQEYGEQWREGLFYTHALGLPAFIFLYKDLKMQALEYNASPIISIGDVAAEWLPGPLSKAIWSVMGLDALRQVFVPEMWLFLVGNVLTQCRSNTWLNVKSIL